MVGGGWSTFLRLRAGGCVTSPHPATSPWQVCTGNTLNTHWKTVESIEDPLVNQNINSFVLHKWPIEASTRNV